VSISKEKAPARTGAEWMKRELWHADLSGAAAAGQALQIAAQGPCHSPKLGAALGMGFRLGANFWTFYAMGVAALIATLAGPLGLGLLLWRVMRSAA
jgi:hypothetical protein